MVKVLLTWNDCFKTCLRERRKGERHRKKKNKNPSFPPISISNRLLSLEKSVNSTNPIEFAASSAPIRPQNLPSSLTKTKTTDSNPQMTVDSHGISNNCENRHVILLLNPRLRWSVMLRSIDSDLFLSWFFFFFQKLVEVLVRFWQLFSFHDH